MFVPLLPNLFDVSLFPMIFLLCSRVPIAKFPMFSCSPKTPGGPFRQWRMLNYFCHLPNIEDIPYKEIWQPNGALNFLMVSTCKMSHTKSIENQSETSKSVSWIFEFRGNLFSSLCVFFNVKSVSVIRSISRVFWLAFDLQLQFCYVDISRTLIFFICIRFMQVYI